MKRRNSKIKIVKKFGGKIIEIRSIAKKDLKQVEKFQDFIN